MLRMFKKRVNRKMFGSKRNKVTSAGECVMRNVTIFIPRLIKWKMKTLSVV